MVTLLFWEQPVLQVNVAELPEVVQVALAPDPSQSETVAPESFTVAFHIPPGFTVTMSCSVQVTPLPLVAGVQLWSVTSESADAGWDASCRPAKLRSAVSIMSMTRNRLGVCVSKSLSLPFPA